MLESRKPEVELCYVEFAWCTTKYESLVGNGAEKTPHKKNISVCERRAQKLMFFF